MGIGNIFQIGALFYGISNLDFDGGGSPSIISFLVFLTLLGVDYTLSVRFILITIKIRDWEAFPSVLVFWLHFLLIDSSFDDFSSFFKSL